MSLVLLQQDQLGNFIIVNFISVLQLSNFQSCVEEVTGLGDSVAVVLAHLLQLKGIWRLHLIAMAATF